MLFCKRLLHVIVQLFGCFSHSLQNPQQYQGLRQTKQIFRLLDDLPIVNHAASSFRDQRYSGFAVDGRPDSRWDSERTDDQWIWVQLARTYLVEEVVLVWEAAFGFQYEVQVSNSTETWETVFVEQNGSGGTDTISMPSNTVAQYVRMRGMKRGGKPWGYSLFQFLVKGNIGDAGIDAPLSIPAQRADAVASSVEIGSTNFASKAIDGDNTTRWSSTFEDDNWIYVRLGGSRRLDQVILLWEAAFAKEYDIQVSNDAFNWLTVFRERDGDGGTDVIDLPPGTFAEYVRMLGVERATDYGYSLFEFFVRGALVGVDPPPMLTIEGVRGSSVEDGTFYSPWNAADGDFSTRFSTQRTDMQWIELELEEASPIARIELFWESAYAKKYLIETSVLGGDNDDNWRTVVNETNGEGGIESYNFPAGTIGKYIRIVGVERGTPWGYSLFEIMVFGPVIDAPDPNPPPTNPAAVVLAISNVTASSVEEQEPDNIPINAVDGNYTTRWSSNRSDPQWLAVELDNTYTLQQVDLYWELAFGLVYDIQTSTNGTAWTTVFQETSGGGGNETINLPADTRGRFVRVFGTQRGTDYGYSLFEVVVWGNP